MHIKVYRLSVQKVTIGKRVLCIWQAELEPNNFISNKVHRYKHHGMRFIDSFHWYNNKILQFLNKLLLISGECVSPWYMYVSIFIF